MHAWVRSGRAALPRVVYASVPYHPRRRMVRLRNRRRPSPAGRTRWR